MSCLFCKIIAKEIPAGIVYEDEKVVAFKDIAPQAPTHILLVPREHARFVEELADKGVVGRIYKIAADLARENKIADSGYRIVVNHGRAAGQAVDHVHFHLLGGRDFSWPPG
ncbi:histidine triad nucleotide-binding protein [candidate division WOR-1 bacterium RIFOXYA12_FULL_52_29]|uniref:Histidine triad nucleotide-binding protein n=1 Tax=candidate division WOR-1 bacterium RIFOXYC12_FULL_54_18 TaxID=1802584 RepID=A0A1F4T8U4_UNCSA|nr:MAG: histidine triad nucleotide-binding protein [candidate division WOR-1 bacterium RIFOXYA2_FULL_51_19]OGC18523.1 MAG: histidine triad nucleotide-binding protein [candidate division WOR-1 bacterium RIFOXYA12_FULL_52_29]OGC27382.1 MAG: histidine triad nucleotide-binding protein [candidate division WOR-1 bacterium RIFOXYB2_FULL_45_9]OGC28940.1 MAG: histidine triad nucleotide-binding protein [candidate division WOR-1 bacterium RIFOXYC12_FULL_54_18]OGC31299.1 MAG: histidine triad nucleotide-bin